MLRKIAPATGGSTTKAESPATLPLIPIKIITKVTIAGAASPSIFCMKAPKKPLRSANPAPMTQTRTMPRGANPEKLETALDQIILKPSKLNRLMTLMVLPVPG